ncbi:Hydrogenase/urease accessory protein HupE [Microbulbifer donghaiensis]|uniref:Hydrogenase/urease accessory protein HupE n=1 Tax=Microbulbifer donghaiensis TaxID=494016 RepID=A0A1M5H7W3_9GAMM|nr:HupE/UreJ family protein [Microbulbifer donghaiensis]SHG11782.1 Hydrogenase/urease accessory protein HupE [Microbulbifer donghaiensis]
MSRLCRSARWLLTGLLVLLAAVPAAQAHESRPAYMEIRETAAGQYTVLWRTPVLAGRRLLVVPRFPEGVRNLRAPVVQELSDSQLERRWIDAGPEGLDGARIEFAGLQLSITDVVVRVHLLDGRSWMAIARPSQPWVEMVAASGGWATFSDFLRQGFAHILSGPDHLLFVFGLLLLVRRRWMLVKTVTAFTIAHSITLAVATLGYVQLPAPPIEAAIALSILFLGLEVLRARRGGTSFTIRHPWVAAFAFGLLHGFGFAGALSAAGLPPTAVPLALVSFNIGVEFGQLAFVAVVLLLARSLSALTLRWPRPVQLLPAYAVGSLGAFWMIQRLLSV